MKGTPFTQARSASVLSLIIVIVAFSTPVRAFYELYTDNGSLDMRGMIRGFGTAYKNPNNDVFFEERSHAGIAGIARLIVQAEVGRHLGFDFNAYQTFIPALLTSSQSSVGAPFDVERSAALERSFSNDSYMRLAVDRLNARYTHNRLDLIIGRQPINLATTFYFTPNDFFAPFAAQVFYRVYKPGVDALRAEVRMGDLSQLSLISVLGYRYDPESNTGWSNSPDGDRTSYIGRVSTVFHEFEGALLGGVVREMKIIGGSLQGELFRWLGVRAEGHIANSNNTLQTTYSELAVGFEHRWENSLNIRLEHLYNGKGASSVSDYSNMFIAASGESNYLGRKYTALSIGYEFTPLLSAEMLAMANLTDHSNLFSFNAIYSLSDEAELAVNIGIPVGDKPEGAEIKSEFGLSPLMATIEARLYF